jgi:hypothetical protein
MVRCLYEITFKQLVYQPSAPSATFRCRGPVPAVDPAQRGWWSRWPLVFVVLILILPPGSRQVWYVAWPLLDHGVLYFALDRSCSACSSM